MTATEARPGSVQDVLDGLDLKDVGPNRWEAASIPSGGWVFGGQLIGQAIAAATAAAPGKQVTSVHSVFARAGRPGEPITLNVAPLHDGRSFASSTVSLSQGERNLATSMVLLSAPERDLVRHAAVAPVTAGPDAATPQSAHLVGWDQLNSDGVDIFDPTALGPPELEMWSRFTTDRKDPVVQQALLAWASVGSFIGTAMRPHEGLGLSIAHHDVSSGVLTHTLTFHDDFDATDWLQLSLRSTYAGSGRVFGTGQVFTQDGTLVASCQQEAFLRALMQANGL